MEPWRLNKMLMQAESLSELLEITSKHVDRMDRINL